MNQIISYGVFDFDDVEFSWEPQAGSLIQINNKVYIFEDFWF